MLTTRHILPTTLDSTLKRYLLYSGSMTQYLSAHFNSPLQVSHKLENCVPASSALQTQFNLRRNAPVWQRDVILSIQNTPIMFARSYIPYADAKRIMPLVGNQPLGLWLFNTPNLKRGEFTYFHVPVNMLSEYELLQPLLPDMSKQDFIWARQSVFFLPTTQLQLIEFFLPDIMLEQHASFKI